MIMSAAQARKKDYDYLIKLILIGGDGKSLGELREICSCEKYELLPSTHVLWIQSSLRSPSKHGDVG